MLLYLFPDANLAISGSPQRKGWSMKLILERDYLLIKTELFNR